MARIYFYIALIISYTLTTQINCLRYCNVNMGNYSFQRNSQRSAKFIKFNSDNGDIALNLDFNLPFVKIPVMETTKTMRSMISGLTTMKIKPLLFGTAAIISGITFMVGLLKSYKMNSKTNRTPKENIFALENFPLTGDETVWEVLQKVEAKFSDSHFDLMSCSQKLVCSLIRKSAENVAIGLGSSLNKLIDGITSSHWFLTKTTGTGFKNAVDVARSELNCDREYNLCNLRSTSLYNSVINAVNTIGRLF